MGLPTSKVLVRCHTPVLVQRLANSNMRLLVGRLKRFEGGGGKGGS